MDQQNLKNIIFDFGDIFIDLDKEAPLKKVKKLGLKELSEETVKVNQAYEKGLISTPDFIDHYANILPEASKDKLKEAWNAIILDFPEYRLNFIEKLASEKNYNLFLLSNTNELHIEEVIRRMGLSRYNRFKNCFKRFYLSHEINLRKPDGEIYHYVLNENGLEATQTLLIDDTAENTIVAEKLGLIVWNLIPGKEDITELPMKYLL